jgi:hypothetical protein
MDRFWTISSRILYHSSWTSSSCFRDFPHSSLRNWPEWISDVQIWWLYWPRKMLKFIIMLFKPWLNSSSCVEWGQCHLGKLHHCLNIMPGSLDIPDYPTCPCTPL